MAEPALKISAELTGLEKSAQKALANIERNTKIRVQVDDKASLPLGKISKNASELESSLDAATSRVIAFGAAAAVFTGIAKTFDNLVTSIIEVEDALAKINVNFGTTEAQLKSFGKEVFNAARNTAKTFEEAAKAAEELARQGLGTDETIKRLNDALILSRRAGIDSAEAVDTLTAAFNSFQASGLDTTQIINKLVAVDTRFAVSTKDLSDAISRAASTAQEAGVSFDEFLGIVTAAQQTTARGGAAIGNALKTIFTRVQAAPETIKALEQLGVAIRDSSGQFTSAGDRLRQYAEIRKSLSDGDRAYYDRLVSGTNQINILSAALNDLGKANSVAAQAQKVASDATNEAILQNEKLNESLKSVISQTGTNFTQLFSSIGGQSGGFLNSALSTFNSILGFINESDGALRGLSNVLSTGLLAGFILVSKTFKFILVDLKNTLATLTGINSAAQTRLKIEQQIAAVTANATSEELRQLNAATSLTERKAAYLAIEQRVTAEMTKQAALSSSLAQSLMGKGVVPGAGGVYSDLAFSKKIKNISGFADPLRSAIQREIDSGIPANQIYIDKDARLKSPNNPMGLMVANKIDEPLGGFQGVNNAIRQGRNPKVNGIVPNFATFDRIKDSSLKDVSGILLSPSEIDFLNKQIIDYGAALLDNSKTLREAAKQNIKMISLDKESEILVGLALEEEQRAYRLILKENKRREKALKKQPPVDLSGVRIIRNPPISSSSAFEASRKQFSGGSFTASELLGNPFLTSRAAKRSVVQSELNRLTSSVRFQQRVFGVNGNLGALGQEDFRRLQETARQKAIQNLGFGGQSEELLQKDRNAQKLIIAERNKILSKLRFAEKENKKIIDEEILRQKAEKRAQRLNTIGLGLAFAAPLAAGFIPEGKGGTNSGIALGGASGALQGAGFGGLLGPIGIAIGAVGGGLIGALNKLEKSVEETSAEFDGLIQVQGVITNSLNSILDIQRAINSNQDSSKRGSLISQQFSLLSNLSPEARQSIIASKFNESTITKEIEKSATREKTLERSKGINVAAAAANPGFFGTFVRPFTSDLEQSDSIARNLTSILPKEIADRIAGNRSLFDAAFQDRTFSKGLGVNSQQLNLVQGFFNEIAKSTNTQAIEVTTTNFKELAQALINGANGARKLAQDLVSAQKAQGGFIETIKGLKNFADVDFSGESALSDFGGLVNSNLINPSISNKIGKNKGFLSVVERLSELGVDISGIQSNVDRAKIENSQQGLLSLAENFLSGRAVFQGQSFKDLSGNISRNKIIEGLSLSRGASDPQEAALARTLFGQFGKETLARQNPLTPLNLNQPDRITGLKPRNALEKGYGLAPPQISQNIPAPESEYTKTLNEAKSLIKTQTNAVEEFNKLLTKITTSALTIDEQRKLVLEVRGDSSLKGEFTTNDPSKFLNELYLSVQEYAKRIEILEAKSGKPVPPKIKDLERAAISNQNVTRAIR